MRKTLGIMLLFIIFTTACSNSEPAIVKVDTPPEEVADEPELIEEVKEDEKVDEFIEFALEDEVVRVNLNQIPILRSYLQAAADKQSVIEKMKIERILRKDDNDIYLLEFSCHNTGCSYLLLDQTSDNLGILLADLTTYDMSLLSPDGTKLLLKFNRGTSPDLLLSNVVVIDLENWEFLYLQNENVTNNMLDYNWPIYTISWVDDETVALSFTEVLQTNNDETSNTSTEEPTTNTLQFNITSKK